MNTAMTQSIQSADSNATEKFGERLGRALRGGEIIELISDLGGGKTTLTRGVVRGTGSTDNVASPTFAVSKVYKAPNYEVVHYDFYRLAEAGILEYELHDHINDPATVMIIEWGDVVQHILPDKRLTIKIKVNADGTRNLLCSCPKDLEYLLT
jgi:tRNA threonylcarbamoyladenosine biosynthesis protein TsaE